jgi:hypothetical protein
MATDDTTQTDDTTHDDTSAETATKTGATNDDKAIEALKAENERIKKAMADANRKGLADRKFREDVERERQQAEDAKLGEAEQLRKQLKALDDARREAEQRAVKLEADLLERRIDTEIERYARPHFTNPELASRLVERDRITFDPDTGKIGGIKDAVEAVLKKYPEIGSAQRGGGSPAAMRTRQPGGGHTPAASEADRMASIREEWARTGNYDQM